MKTARRTGSHVQRAKLRDMTGKRYYILDLYDLGFDRFTGRRKFGYDLKHSGKVIFSTDKLECAGNVAPWSDTPVQAAFGFCSLRPGDTDEEYFESYTEEQRRWAEEHGEWLSYKNAERFGS